MGQGGGGRERDSNGGAGGVREAGLRREGGRWDTQGVGTNMEESGNREYRREYKVCEAGSSDPSPPPLLLDSALILLGEISCLSVVCGGTRQY